jgi:hypothetical protein
MADRRAWLRLRKPEMPFLYHLGSPILLLRRWMPRRDCASSQWISLHQTSLVSDPMMPTNDGGGDSNVPLCKMQRLPNSSGPSRGAMDRQRAAAGSISAVIGRGRNRGVEQMGKLTNVSTVRISHCPDCRKRCRSIWVGLGS